MLKVAVIGSNGKPGKSFTAKDGDHAQRIKETVKAQQKPGHSVDFKVTKES